MRKFDINLAKQGKPVGTRDGYKARIICFDKAGVYPIIALVQEEGMETCHFYAKDGKCVDYKHKYDLMMLPEKRSGWVNVYKECDGEYYVEKVVYKIKGHAVENASSQNYVGTVRIEFYE